MSAKSPFELASKCRYGVESGSARNRVDPDVQREDDGLQSRPPVNDRIGAGLRYPSRGGIFVEYFLNGLVDVLLALFRANLSRKHSCSHSTPDELLGLGIYEIQDQRPLLIMNRRYITSSYATSTPAPAVTVSPALNVYLVLYAGVKSYQHIWIVHGFSDTLCGQLSIHRPLDTAFDQGVL